MVKTWVEVCQTRDVPEGQVRTFKINGLQVAICHVKEGEFYAVQDVCTHDNAPLGEGELFDNVIECPRHGARFDVKTGRVLALPAVVPIQTYPVKVEGNVVKAEIQQ